MRHPLSLLVPGLSDARMDFRLRSQLPYIAMTAFFLLVTYLLLVPFTYLDYGFDRFFFALLGSLAVVATALLCLRKGLYRAAADLTTLGLLGGSLAVLFLMQYNGLDVIEAYRGLAFAAVMAAINVAVALRPGQIWLFFGLYSSGWCLAFATIFRHHFGTNRTAAFVLLSVGLLGLLSETVMLYLVKRLSARMLSTAEEQTRKANDSLDRVTRLLADASEGMGIGSRVLAAAEHSQHAVSDIAEIQDYLGRESGELVEGTKSLIGSSRKVLESAHGMEDDLLSQNSAITETSAALVEISQNIESINAVANQRRGMLAEAAKAGRAQSELIAKLDAAFQSVRESSDGVGRFVDTVQDIASRTSLLSMNASIEAARAGSAGKGFAVVSQEIRSLSGETQKNADLIKQIIAKNDQTVAETGKLMAEFSRFVARNVEDNQALLDSIDEIMNGIAEMSAGTAEVMKAVEQMVQGTESSGEMVKVVVSQIDAQQASLDHLTEFAQGLDKRIAGLREAVSEIRESTDLVAESGRLNVEQMKKLQSAD